MISQQDRHFRQINGIWYEFILKPLPNAYPCVINGQTIMVRHRVHDLLKGRDISTHEARRIYGTEVYAVDKRRCSHQDIHFLLHYSQH